MTKRTAYRNRFGRRGTAAAMTAMSGTVLIGFTALAVDVGVLYYVRGEAQRSADAGALAGAWELLGEERVLGSVGMTVIIDRARNAAVTTAGVNPVYGSEPEVDPNPTNCEGGDVLIGHLENPSNLMENMSIFEDPAQFNAVKVLVRRDSERNGPIPLLFGQVFGILSSDVSASAVAAATDGTDVVGYKKKTGTENPQLLPFSLHVASWNELLAVGAEGHDGYAYSTETRSVTEGVDGIPELNLYPGGGTTKSNDQDEQNQYWGPVQITPGNFGTVDIGNPNNSTADIVRQILYGVSEEDLSYFGGELKLGEDGTLILNGDSGLSGGFKAALESIIGQPRTIPLFSEVNGPGNNSMYTIVGFAGIRIVYVKLTGPLSKKCVLIQPAVVVDSNVIIEDGSDTSHFIFEPPHLVR